MTSAFLSEGVWPEITKAVRNSRNSCFAAVAYFGAGASRLLPLRPSSRLVVDASERAVASGQTCPADLREMVNRGVFVYTVPNLHAKVFVAGRTAYIGSANVSSRSASLLVEAMVRTTDANVVSEAREFVKDLCLDELTPESLKQLAKLYRPPQIPGGGRGRQQKEILGRPTLRLFLTQLKPVELSERERELREKGSTIAKKRRKHPRSWEMEDFFWTGKCPFVQGDRVIQVSDEGNGKLLVAPPANVRYVLTGKQVGNKLVSFVYLERPARRRQQVRTLARTLNCTPKKLRRNGLVRDQAFAKALLKTLAFTA